MLGIIITIILLFTVQRVFPLQSNPWDLPVLPPQPAKLPAEDFGGKRIPRHLWLTFRFLPKHKNETKDHLQIVFERQQKLNWTVHLNDDSTMETFLNDKFANTSLLWAYNAIHPRLGVARADLWRYAILWYYGGVYLDDDSNFGVPFDDVS
jgi:inositol phosphorylceramide mannosyltransferase catalytic subunit